MLIPAYEDQPVDESSYSITDLQAVDLHLKDIGDIGQLVCDLFEILSNAISKRQYLPEDRLKIILNASQNWKREDCVHKMHQILRADLELRPPGNPSTSLIQNTISTSLNGLVTSLLSSSPSNLTALQCQLHYIVNVLTKYHHPLAENKQFSVKEITIQIDKVLKRSILKQIVGLLSTVNHLLLKSSSTLGILSELHQDLQTLLCLPLLSTSSSRTKDIVCLLAEELSQISSLNERKTLLQLLPSDLLREKIIDLHLEKECCLHSSADHFRNTELFQNAESSFSKFCCVHLCRMPYQHDGKLQDPSYLLFLLCSLLQALLSLHMGGPNVSLPFLTSHIPTSEISCSAESRGILASVKSHIPHFIDRLMEDANILEYLVQPQCWMYLQLLCKMTDLTGQTVTASFTSF